MHVFAVSIKKKILKYISLTVDSVQKVTVGLDLLYPFWLNASNDSQISVGRLDDFIEDYMTRLFTQIVLHLGTRRDYAISV